MTENAESGGPAGASGRADGSGGGFLTVGHSNRELAVFLDMLVSAGVEVVVDVRRLPGSDRYPQFNADALAGSLAEVGIEYRREERLGGRRRVSTTVPDAVNGFWDNRSFHNYADHGLSEEFAAGLGCLRELGAGRRVAILCSEAVWWRCHRRIIADHLLAAGLPVDHLMGPGKRVPAQLTPGAVVRDDGRVAYPGSS